MTRKMVFHAAIADPWMSEPLAIAYATRPPKIWPHPLKLNQIPVRVPCSRLVYHCKRVRGASEPLLLMKTHL